MTLGNDNGTDGQTDRQTECDAICGPLLGRGPHNKLTAVACLSSFFASWSMKQRIMVGLLAFNFCSAAALVVR